MSQDDIVELLRKHGKLSKKDMIKKTKMARSTLHFELSRLDRKNMLDSEKIGRKIYYSLRGVS
jgi:DNA-binding transcriptional ArsR family regulator